MSNDALPSTEGSSSKKLFLLGLLAAVFCTNVIDVLAPLLYPEIAQAFNIQVGTAVQLSAFSAIAGVITGFALSAFSIKIRYKTLLMVGVLCIVFCALGVYLAPSFGFAQIFYSLNGVGSVIVSIMTATLIGEIYPLEKKAIKISWVVATSYIAILVGNPITGFIANTGGIAGFRTVLVWFMLPVSAISLILVFFLVPFKPQSSLVQTKKEPFLSGFKEVLTNKSAVSCLISAFGVGAFFASSVFASSFLKLAFALTPFQRSLVTISGLIFLVTGIMVGGVLVNKFGRKNLTVATSIPAISLSIAAYVISMNVQNIWLYLIIRWIGGLAGGIPLVAGANLALEQIPRFRGTMMSLQSALGGTGGAFGILIGGFIINFFSNPLVGYPLMMITVGSIGITGCTILYLFAKDPCKTKSTII
jgi:predicted MFS family arabinose efflux permease